MTTAQEQDRSASSETNSQPFADSGEFRTSADDGRSLNEVSDSVDEAMARYCQPLTPACREHAIGIAKRLFERSYERFKTSQDYRDLDQAFHHIEQIRSLEYGRNQGENA